MGGKIGEPRGDHAGRALLVPMLDALGGSGALEQLHVVIDLVEVPVRRVLFFEFCLHFVDNGALVGEERRVIVARALDTHLAFFLDAEKVGDECTDMRRKRYEQLRGGDIVEIGAAVFPVCEVRLMQL